MNVLNSQYNKAVYGGVVAAMVTILSFIAQQYGIELGPEVQTAIVTILTAAVVYRVPNKAIPAPHPDNRPK